MNRELSSSSLSRGPGTRSRSMRNSSATRTLSVKLRARKTTSVWSIRLVFLFFLVAAASVLGFLAYYIVRGSEKALAEQQYEALTARALNIATELTVRRRVVGKSMAKVAGSAFPDKDQWPNVAIPAFETFAADLIRTSDNTEIAFYPLVTPSQIAPGEQDAFEDFANRYFYANSSPSMLLHNDTTTELPDDVERLFVWGHWSGHDTHGRTDRWDSKYRILFPELQNSNHGPKGRLTLMFNIHSVERLGGPLDDVIACSRERKMTRNLEMDCSAETRIFSTKRASYLIQPIYPARDLFELTGVIVSKVSWDIIMARMFEDTVATGLTAVMESEGKSYSYSVEDREAVFRKDGLGDAGLLYGYGRTKLLSGASSRQYSLTLIPTEDFFEVYTTENPTYAMVGAVLVVIATSIIFVFYDCVVRREFTAKQKLLQAKRKFVRFISHEVRTPLNAVCMGLTLLQDEIKVLQKKRGTRPGTRGAAILSQIETKCNDVSSNTRRQMDVDLDVWLSLLEDIHGSSSSAVDVLSDLLLFDKVETGTLALELTVFSMWDFINDAARDFGSVAKKKNINFELDSTPLLGCCDELSEDIDHAENGAAVLPRKLQQSGVVGDKVRLTQALAKLISSAVRFTPEQGSVIIRTSFLEAESDEDQSSDPFILNSGEEVAYDKIGFLQVDVVDAGPGISQDQLSLIRRDGVQFDVAELQTGQMSLSLLICKDIVTQHGGRISVSSEGLDCGATFSLILPLHHVPGAMAEPCVLPNGPVEDPSMSKGSEEEVPLELRVLVVDDVATNRKLLARLVRNHGHSTVEAADGLEAVEKAMSALQEGRPFDSILMDWEMPELPGPEATTRIRELGCKQAFIVGVSGNVAKDDVDYFISCGADAVLPKPVDIKRLDKLWLENNVGGGNPRI